MCLCSIGRIEDVKFGMGHSLTDIAMKLLASAKTVTFSFSETRQKSLGFEAGDKNENVKH